MRRLVLLLCAIVVLASATTFAQTDDEGQPAPRFHAKTTAGEQFDNQSTRGKVVLLQFWATWCKYCRAEQPLVDSLDKEFAADGLVTLAIDVGEDKKVVKQYLEQNPRSCRIVYMGDTNLAAMYAATAYPIYVVIDRDGKIVATQRGAAGERALRNLLRRAGLQAKSNASSSGQ